MENIFPLRWKKMFYSRRRADGRISADLRAMCLQLPQRAPSGEWRRG